MDKTELVNEQIDAGSEFIEAFSKYEPINVAFWLNPADSEVWHLYIASKSINDNNLDIAYGEVLRLVGSGRTMWLDAFQIRLLNSDDPLAVKAIEIRGQYPGGTRYNGSSIAGVAINAVYLYPKDMVSTIAK